MKTIVAGIKLTADFRSAFRITMSLEATQAFRFFFHFSDLQIKSCSKKIIKLLAAFYIFEKALWFFLKAATVIGMFHLHCRQQLFDKDFIRSLRSPFEILTKTYLMALKD